jgi:Lar family restriction alleviation protein
MSRSLSQKCIQISDKLAKNAKSDVLVRENSEMSALTEQNSDGVNQVRNTQQSSEMVELRPCPFCGGQAKRFTIGDEEPSNAAGGDVICCERCGASSHVEFGYKENLVSNWNSRVEASHHAEIVSSCTHLLACIDMCDEAGAPPCELDQEDLSLIAETRALLAKIGEGQ